MSKKYEDVKGLYNMCRIAWRKALGSAALVRVHRNSGAWVMGLLEAQQLNFGFWCYMPLLLHLALEF